MTNKSQKKPRPTMASLREEVKSLKARNQELQKIADDVNTSREDIDAVVAENQGLKTKLSSTEKTLAKTKKEKEENSKLFKKLAASKEAADSALTRAQNAQSRASKDLDSAQSLIREQKVRIQTLRDEKSTLNSKFKAYKNLVDRLSWWDRFMFLWTGGDLT